MKICLINTSDSGGGAPVACKRLLHALNAQQEVVMLVQDKNTIDESVKTIIHNKWDKARAQYRFLRERLPFIAFYERDKSVRFAFSTAETGIDISGNKFVKSADILHLHWINRGFLSVNSLKSLIKLNKPVVWTLHDMWTFTGGCHYSGDCHHFIKSCGNCKFLRNPSENDISKLGYLKKENLYKNSNKIVFVACSKWLAQIAKKSSLLKGFRIESIPNPIDTSVYHPLNNMDIKLKRNISENAKIILFGAANINDKRKGISYLLEAMRILKSDESFNEEIHVVLFGKNTSLNNDEIPFSTTNLSIISSEKQLVEIYNLADVFVLPSLEDNLPNMVMEALACGIPVVGFNQGGVPEMIDHQQNGYLADYKSADDLASGIKWVIKNTSINLKENARKKVLNNYTEAIVAQKYEKIYHTLLEN